MELIIELLHYGQTFIIPIFIIICIIVIGLGFLFACFFCIGPIVLPIIVIFIEVFKIFLQKIKRGYKKMKDNFLKQKLEEINKSLNDNLSNYLIVIGIIFLFICYVINDKVILHTNLKYLSLCKIENKEKINYLKDLIFPFNTKTSFSQKATKYLKEKKNAQAILYYSLAIRNGEKNIDELYYYRGKSKYNVLKKFYSDKSYFLKHKSFAGRKKLSIINEIENDFLKAKNFKEPDINMYGEFWAYYGNSKTAEKELDALIKNHKDLKYLYYYKAIAMIKNPSNKSLYYNDSFRKSVYQNFVATKDRKLLYDFYKDFAYIKEILFDYNGAINEYHNVLKNCTKNNYKYKAVENPYEQSDIVYLPEWINNEQYLYCSEYPLINNKIQDLEFKKLEIEPKKADIFIPSSDYAANPQRYRRTIN